jgi:hypothetical protein
MHEVLKRRKRSWKKRWAVVCTSCMRVKRRVKQKTSYDIMYCLLRYYVLLTTILCTAFLLDFYYARKKLIQHNFGQIVLIQHIFLPPFCESVQSSDTRQNASER